MERFKKYTQDVRQALAFAREEARRLRHRLIGTEHLLLGILKLQDPLIEGVFASLHTSSASMAQTLEFVLGRGGRAFLSEPVLSPAARVVLAHAMEEASESGTELVNSEHLLLAIFRESDGVSAGVLESFNISPDIVRERLSKLREEDQEYLLLSVRYQSRYEATPALNQVSRDLTMAALAGALDPMIGREVELERTMQILSRRTKNNPVLIGPAGVGKTAIAEGLALRIIQEQAPDNLLNCRVVALDMGMLAVGTKFRGDFEERLRKIMQEILASPGIIIVIDEVHLLVQTGVAEGSIDASNLFKPMLARGEFRCIGATTFDEYRKTIETDPALERRFQPVQVAETSDDETLEILQGLRSRYEDFHQVSISHGALKAAVKMSSRYIQNRYQPDKAIDLIDEAASRIRVQGSVAPEHVRQLRDEVAKTMRDKDYAIAHHDFPEAAALLKHERQLRQALWQDECVWLADHQRQRPIVTEQDIAEIVSSSSGVPVVQIAEEESVRLLNLEAELHQRIIGQDEAVRAIARAVRRSRTNVRDSRRPIGSFLFVGPTGVGKTELARALAVTLFGDEKAMLKLDMSEFMESHQASRLIGTPPGYVGYDQAGQLTEAIKRRPYSVVLFDEVEKAHPKIFDLLLQILEDGCLTDAHGQRVDFRHTIIILTSNVGSAQLAHHAMSFTRTRDEQQLQEDTHKRMSDQIMPALKELFRPELLNRIDEVIVFHSLQPRHLSAIVDLMLAQTQQRLNVQSIDLQVTDAARLMLSSSGYNPEYGARPLRRAVQSLLEDMLAEAILKGDLCAGNSVAVDAVDGNLIVNVLIPTGSTIRSEPASQEAA